MKFKIIFSFVILLLLIGIIGAVTDTNIVDDVFKINEIVNYKKPCFNNGTYCSDTAACNYTIFNPDGSVLIDNQQGTNQGSYHNISFVVSNIGVYQVDMTCVDGNTGAGTLYFEVTGSGFHNTGWFYLLILALSLGVMIVGFYVKDAPIVIFGTFGLYFLGLYILFNGLVGLKDPIYTWSSGLIVLGIAFYVSARSTYELIVD